MKALIIVDVQNDFLPGGALAVKDGNLIIPIINKLQKKFAFIVATQDWHPGNHGSFAANHPGLEAGEFVQLNGVKQILWPIHCVQESKGAEFHPELERKNWTKIFQKGTNPLVDSYSGFFDNNKNGDTGLSDFLKSEGVREIYICGLAADYCVKFTVLDGIDEGFTTYLITDATKAVNLKEGDFQKALEDMEDNGAILIDSSSI
ncbi:MAG: bifunctional nicotinamidase/pyrazinamidase [Mongoliibacter sp.]|uniref:bifunctional nicotinamidase/pyrazinamidase n=1 Tax=Mongoliibacter sp. TaxID=2022438 RepID=UPI0012F19035|nr:bifunctional nicotinamidase/pyrazinamidase [Mongoliibacter sp.]TVP48905.1 MAG: bifunctional nicotinamidase/pyrazinamidase [Mongoliibacter sp.]